MEHRLEGRKEIRSPVLVIIDHREIVKASVKDISFGGMLMDTGARRLEDGVVIELACTAFRQCGWKIIRLKARVIHVKDGLAGIKFIENRKRSAALWSELEARAAEWARCRPVSGGGEAEPRTVTGKPGMSGRPYRRSERRRNEDRGR